jgi:hypothetical protein
MTEQKAAGEFRVAAERIITQHVVNMLANYAFLF